MSAESSPRSRVIMRQVNEMMSESLVLRDSSTIAFFCECADSTCYEPVWLSRVEFETAKLDPAWAALIEGHSAAGDDGEDTISPDGDGRSAPSSAPRRAAFGPVALRPH